MQSRRSRFRRSLKICLWFAHVLCVLCILKLHLLHCDSKTCWNVLLITFCRGQHLETFSIFKCVSLKQKRLCGMEKAKNCLQAPWRDSATSSALTVRGHQGARGHVSAAVNMQICFNPRRLLALKAHRGDILSGERRVEGIFFCCPKILEHFMATK